MLRRWATRAARKGTIRNRVFPWDPTAGLLLAFESSHGINAAPFASSSRRFSSQGEPPTNGGNRGSIYIHHSDVGAAINAAGLTVGLMTALRALVPGVGYFRPIDHTSHGGKRAELIRDIFKIDTPLEEMVGCTQQEAVALIARDKADDLLELILPAFEKCKARHDFVVIEGTSMRDGSNTSPINGLIALTLNSPALIVNDAEAAALGSSTVVRRKKSFEDWDWEKSAVGSVVDHARIMRHSNVDVAGALYYRVPKVERGSQVLQAMTTKEGIPFIGALPTDKQLEGLQVEDVKKVLDAQLLYGEEDELGGLMGTEINQTIVATLHLADFLSYIPNADSPTKGALIVAHASRPDVLLGMINLHETSLPTQVAAMVLTGGSLPPLEIDTLIRSRPTKCSLPVLLSPMATNDTIVAIAECQPQLHSTSTRKIERANFLFQNNVDLHVLNQAMFKERPIKINPLMFEHNIFVKAKEANMHIVLPEGDEPRTVQAAGEVLRRELARITLLGDPEKIKAQARQLRVDLEGANLVNPADSPQLEEYVESLWEKRKAKLTNIKFARDLLIGDVNYFGTMMVEAGHADGMVSGAINTTANTVRPALQVVKTVPSAPLVSSVFFMCLPDKVLVYGDCAVNENPNPEELATIAISSAETALAFGIEPRVAMLSYATGDSNAGPIIQKVADATAIAQKRRPDLAIEGPLQYDAAVNPETAKTKMKGKETKVAGKATVLIFPDLNTGNNTYKAVQQSTGAVAMGPVLQGLRKPVNDLSRGCTVKDIVTTIAITSLQAVAMKKAAQKV